MKKSWIIVLAFVFLYSAVPAFSVPVPSTLCLYVGDSKGPESIRLILNSEGKIGNVEYFRVSGSWVWDEGEDLLTGSAHRQGRKVLHLGLTGAFDEDGPGGGGVIYKQNFDVSYNLKQEKGPYSYFYIVDGGGPPVKTFIDGMSAISTLKAVDCSSLPEPPW